ncbi:MAG: riboflavin synthase [Cyclobacteriaceae bacterium]
MFTGIIEAIGKVESIDTEGTNKTFKVRSDISNELKIDQSLAHNGVCLTVTSVNDGVHSVTAIEETLIKSNIGALAVGGVLNLERCMASDGRFDGHIVQGHVDQTAVCESVEEKEGSWIYDFTYDPDQGNVTVEKGSVTVNGISLTCFNSRLGGFTVAIIPYTYEHTNFHKLTKGDVVNLEFDIIGKYIARITKGY